MFLTLTQPLQNIGSMRLLKPFLNNLFLSFVLNSKFSFASFRGVNVWRFVHLVSRFCCHRPMLSIILFELHHQVMGCFKSKLMICLRYDTHTQENVKNVIRFHATTANQYSSNTAKNAERATRSRDWRCQKLKYWTVNENIVDFAASLKWFIERGDCGRMVISMTLLLHGWFRAVHGNNFSSFSASPALHLRSYLFQFLFSIAKIWPTINEKNLWVDRFAINACLL